MPASLLLVGALLVGACGPSAAPGGPQSGASGPAAPAGVVGGATAPGDPGPVGATPQITPSGSSPAAVPSSVPMASPVVPAPPIPGAWSSLGWRPGGAIEEAVQLVAAVRWHDLDVVAGLAVGTSGGLSTRFWTSTGGRTWAVAADPGGAFGGTQVERLVAGPSGLLAFGIAGAGCPSSCSATLPVVEWTSADGRTWGRSAGSAAFAGARVTAAAAAPAGFVAAGTTAAGGAVWWSRDGRSWVRATGGTFSGATPTSVAWFRGAWLVGGRIGGQTPTAGITPPSTSRAAAWWSTDGRTWHAATVQGTAERGATLGTIEAGRDGLVAIGSDMPRPGRSAFAWTSSDGRTWIPAGASGDGVPAFDVAGNGTQIVGLGPGADGTLQAWASLDGAAWQALDVSAGGASLPAAPGSAAANAIGAWFALPGGVLAAGRPRGGPSTVSLPLFVAAGR